jgi:hypothetical protein
MGWASAGAIFGPIAKALIDHGASNELKLLVCDKLIGVLQEGDWDTEGESLDEFAGDPVIVEAFRRHGITLPCLVEHTDDDGWWQCDLERGHDGEHVDGRHSWPQAGSDDV